MALNRLAPASGLSLAGRGALRALAAGTTPPAATRSSTLPAGPVACALADSCDLQPEAPMSVAASSARTCLVVGVIFSSGYFVAYLPPLYLPPLYLPPYR